MRSRDSISPKSSPAPRRWKCSLAPCSSNAALSPVLLVEEVGARILGVAARDVELAARLGAARLRELGDHLGRALPRSPRRPSCARRARTTFDLPSSGRGYAAVTGFVIEPTPSISIVISSPGCSQTGGFRNAPTPAGVPVMIRSPGSSVIACGDERDHLGDAEDLVRRVRVLHRPRRSGSRGSAAPAGRAPRSPGRGRRPAGTCRATCRAPTGRRRTGGRGPRRRWRRRSRATKSSASSPRRRSPAGRSRRRARPRSRAAAQIGGDADRLAEAISVFGHLAKSSGRSGSSTPCSSAWSR